MTYVLVTFCLLVLGRAEYLKYKDPKQSLAVRIKDLLGRMTLAEKIGQMTQIEREVATTEAMSKYFIGTSYFTYAATTADGEGLVAEFVCVTNWYDAGSVLSGGGSVPAPQASAEAWASMLAEMQKGALSTRLGIPMIYGIDAVHGHNNVYRATIFPHNIGLGATR
jgi:beta-glucosidase-like glycosyl hydrolase